MAHLIDRNTSRQEFYELRRTTTCLLLLFLAMILPITNMLSSPSDVISSPATEGYVSGRNAETTPSNAKIVALGDSTVSLADGRLKDSIGGCKHEEGTWIDQLDIGAVSLACSGDTVRQTTNVARSTPALGDDTEMVFITVGTNSLRDSVPYSSLVRQLDRLVETVWGRAPYAEIVFVGYLPLHSNSDCKNHEQVQRSRYVDAVHLVANEALIDVADRGSIDYVDTTGHTFDMCDGEESFIHLPYTHRGTPWHTTGVGHAFIASRVAEDIDLSFADDDEE